MTTESRCTSYETESKINMAELREAAQKVFAYDPSASQRDSVESHAVRHRKRARKGNKRPDHS